MSKESFDIHQTITDRIVAAIEAGAGPWKMPWHRGAGGRRPVNAASGKAYQGVNVLALWVEATGCGYSSHNWGTYRQWAATGCQVRRGCKAAHVVFYKQIEVQHDDPDADDDQPDTRLFARATPVFNANLVNGFTIHCPAGDRSWFRH
ncbi:ArdC family protein [Prosthecomicrobium hirschii]|uniref:ArdC family protein n=1 Tax=Prosthecodimorpha hirschii TaxID=665126 RepID=UPI00221E86DD|nr:ArdC family protein [Prosthecomicrobium hirschii]MCW1841766.1 ArdC family protein [Prosthecomicrobium hirschii]